MPEIVIDIAADGSVQVEGQDFSGPECKQLTARLEEALGEVERVETKPEYREKRSAVKRTGVTR